MKRSMLFASTLVLCSGLFASPAVAQEIPPPIPSLHQQGFGAVLSWLSGSGFAYRRWSENGLGFQLAGVPYIVPPTTFVNVGAQAMAQFLRTPSFRAYGLAGVGLGIYTNTTVIGIPVGAGIDWFINDNLALTFGLGYTVSSNHPNGIIAFDVLAPGPSVGVMLEW